MKKAGLDPMKVSALIVTHRHVDHLYGIPSLAHNMGLAGRRTTLRVYALTETMPILHGFMQLFPLDKPKRGDVIVFIYPLDPSKDFIKRVVAVEEDTVKIINKKLYINGVQVPDPHEITFVKGRFECVVRQRFHDADGVTRRGEQHILVPDIPTVKRHASLIDSLHERFLNLVFGHPGLSGPAN